MLIASAASMFGVDAIRWGAVIDGLQLGIAASSAPEPALRIVLKNAGSKVLEAPIGFQDHDIFYNVEITARTPQGDELAVFDLKTIGRHVTSCCGPGPEKTVRLDPGGVQEFTYPLSRLFVVNGTDMPLTKFLKQGYSVRATLRLHDTEIASPDLLFRK
ncbi:MAG: hypothetical protein ABSF64_02985 [Bryobacteraceae bacterium]